MRLYVHVPSQTLDLLDDSDTVIRRYTISTSKYGLGSEPGSNKTPIGQMRIAEKIGDGAPAGVIFKSRVQTEEFGKEGDPEDRVQTRILWLEGFEHDNANTKDRYIYIHGTNAESQLGIPASHGCVRMNNEDIIDLYAQVEVGTPVMIEA
ncbi:MAG: L,D-transpeptidase [Verrucomicrobiaceae bacterium]|nr:MAG: L,D-transpeptidase [Verrucomicrobiaceae bacterium]